MIQSAGHVAVSAVRVIMQWPDEVEFGRMGERFGLEETPGALLFLA